MRIFAGRPRIEINRQNARQLFLAELDYYRNQNQHPVNLFGKSLINIYKNINVQVLITEKCNYNCHFCIENKATGEKDQNLASLLGEVLTQYNQQGITPCVSITGGEPGLYWQKVNEILAVVKNHAVKSFNLNSNGQNLAKIVPVEHINLSRHHYLPQKIATIFDTDTLQNSFATENFAQDVTMQCVLLKEGINSPTEIKNYLEHYCSNPRVKGFSFRGLSKLDQNKAYPPLQIKYLETQTVDFFAILTAVDQDPSFEFVQQKIGDHYLFEIYNYRGYPVRFTYSDFALLREIEAKERKNNLWYSRATVLRPNGKVYAGWTYDLNQITF